MPRLVLRLIPVLVLVGAAVAAVSTPPTAASAATLPVPPPGGVTIGVAGTSDPAALAAAQAFDVHSIWQLAPTTQRWLVYRPSGFSLANTLTSDTLSADAVVTIRRAGTLVPGSVLPPPPPTGVESFGEGTIFASPPPGGVVQGLAGTNDPARLVERQTFEVASVFMFDVPSQRWLSFIPGAPALVSSLRTGLLTVDSVVTVRRAATTAPAPAPTPSTTPSPTPAPTPAPTSTPVPSGVTVEEAQMVALVNEERTSRGLGSLEIDVEMTITARAHSADMEARNYFAHTNPDGLDPFDRMDAAGIDYRTAGENLALANSVTRAHELLMDSPGHRANILNGDFGRIGIGIVETSQGRMVTQLFAD